MNENKIINVGSRKSELALIQTKHVISLLQKIHPEKKFEIITMSTLGDKVLDIPLPKIGEKSLFTKELETALATGCVDFVVHSLKDLPTTLPKGMVIGAVLSREDPRDALVLRQDCQNCTLETLPQNSVVGTSSLRRTAQLAKKYPHLRVESIRGNLNTRLKKLDELDCFHAIILAAAGLQRMGWNHRISKIIDEREILYAVGQGALAVECRESDDSTISLLQALYDPHTAIRIIAERSFLKTLGGGCSAPVAVTTKLALQESAKFKITLKGAVWSLDGKDELIESDATVIEIKDTKRCSVCPYNYKNLSPQKDKSCAPVDIECLSQCKRRSTETREEVPSKKQKSNELSVELLKEDPHERCPVKLPVGVDFMGKCPYLESHSLVNIHPINIENLRDNLSKCPFLRENTVLEVSQSIDEPGGSEEPKMKLYTGLVPHVDVPEWALDEAQNLGKRIAEKLMKIGAMEIMAKAQAVIRNN